ncbi:hypothetical protein Lesp02_69270 [Lentzea sp. NBRC 105346]|uniref:hypothetical protein n=1 Tax=Lentzea sp. NBRC 105346 TaxID=3032205 RepID=UPI0024A54283|nr:hypothetical protein [Lentzea sp. NBRC 105346]GLZ34740.1 hypothetical protein Lesp02_69270 [Lentzea sp. NBRC 105346]
MSTEPSGEQTPPPSPYPPAQQVGYTQPYPQAPQYQQQQYPGPQYPYAPPVPQYAMPRQQARTSYGLCFLAAAVWSFVMFVVLFVLAGPPASAYAFGRVLGSQLVPCLLASLFTWLIFKKRSTNFAVLAVVALPFYFVVLVLVNAGRGVA